MRRLVPIFALAAGAGALTAASATDVQRTQPQAARRQGSQCFNARMVTDFRPVNRDQIDITVPGRRVYRLDLGPGCFDINWANSIGLVSRTGSFVCGPLDAEIVSPSLAGRSHCYVTGMRQLTDAEAQMSPQRGHHH